MLRRQCPCCGKPLSLSNYFFKRKNNLIICQYCKNTMDNSNYGIKGQIGLVFLYIFAGLLMLSQPKGIIDYLIVFIMIAIPMAMIDYLSPTIICEKENLNIDDGYKINFKQFIVILVSIILPWVIFLFIVSSIGEGK